jgi:hypothetical protein
MSTWKNLGKGYIGSPDGSILKVDKAGVNDRTPAKSESEWARVSKMQTDLGSRQLSFDQTKFAYQASSKIMPIIGIGLLLIFIIGPGISGILSVAAGLSWYWWVAIGVVALMIMRNR